MQALFRCKPLPWCGVNHSHLLFWLGPDGVSFCIEWHVAQPEHVYAHVGGHGNLHHCAGTTSKGWECDCWLLAKFSGEFVFVTLALWSGAEAGECLCYISHQ